VGLAAWRGLAGLLCDEVGGWAASTAGPDGGVVLDLPWVRADLARCRAEVEAMRLLNWRMACDTAAGEVSPAESSAVKVFGVERSIDVYRRLLGIVGVAGYLAPGSHGAILRGRLERSARGAQINTFGGGVNEIQREIVATAGLGMRRGSR
jgi:alkylation response protein AidB-like acyl-CoA dehydrogenase